MGAAPAATETKFLQPPLRRRLLSAISPRRTTRSPTSWTLASTRPPPHCFLPVRHRLGRRAAINWSDRPAFAIRQHGTCINQKKKTFRRCHERKWLRHPFCYRQSAIIFKRSKRPDTAMHTKSVRPSSTIKKKKYFWFWWMAAGDLLNEIIYFVLFYYYMQHMNMSSSFLFFSDVRYGTFVFFFFLRKNILFHCGEEKMQVNKQTFMHQQRVNSERALWLNTHDSRQPWLLYFYPIGPFERPLGSAGPEKENSFSWATLWLFEQTLCSWFQSSLLVN